MSEHASFGKRVEATAIRLSGSPLFWLAFVAVLFAYPISGAVNRRVPDPPPVMFALPDFALTDHLGLPFGSKELAGHVWIANFIFTSCPTRCPELTETMKKVQKRMRNMGDAVFLVSISVDPEHDTPEKLAEYAKQHQVNFRRWRFLTGDLTSVKNAVEKGFKMPMDPSRPDDGKTLIDITHGTRFVLVDQHNRVRGLYETDEANIDQMVSDLAVLANLGDGALPSADRSGAASATARLIGDGALPSADRSGAASATARLIGDGEPSGQVARSIK